MHGNLRGFGGPSMNDRSCVLHAVFAVAGDNCYSQHSSNRSPITCPHPYIFLLIHTYSGVYMHIHIAE